MSLSRSLMIRGGMLPRIEGLRLHCYKQSDAGVLLRVSGFVQPQFGASLRVATSFWTNWGSSISLE